MLAYAQLLVTRSRGGMGRCYGARSALRLSAPRPRVVVQGPAELTRADRCLTLVRGQGTMSFNFGYGDPSSVSQYLKPCELRLPTLSSDRRTGLLGRKKSSSI